MTFTDELRPFHVQTDTNPNDFDDETEAVDNDLYPDELDESSNSLEDDQYPNDDEYESDGDDYDVALEDENEDDL